MTTVKRNKRPKFANLDPNYNLRSRWEQTADVAEYANKLDYESKTWLNKFMGEYVNGSFEKKNENNIQKTKKLKKDCYDRNNARNRDILTKAKAMGKAVYLEDLSNKDIKKDFEENLINAIDNGFDLTDFYPTFDISKEVEMVENELLENELEEFNKTKTKGNQS